MALSSRMTKPLFPRLWDARVEMTSNWSREGGYAPGESRKTVSGSGMHKVVQIDGDDANEDDAPSSSPARG
jgi:hypothetical protein